MKLLFADDETCLQELMRLELPRRGHQVTVCPNGSTAIASLEMNTYDCIIVDLDMPDMSGIDVIAHAKSLSPETESVILTGKSSFETAVEALRLGAFDYLTKPCKMSDIEQLLRRVAEKHELKNKYRAVKQQLDRLEGGSRLVRQSSEMNYVRQLISKVAPTHSTVLVLGETGTGKELVARAVHDQSAKADQPFVPVNCGALPENLIESELFGHRKGAFTGADEQRVGLFEVANGGTLFLDEIGELPKSMQAKLLRVLESGEVRRVGDNESFRVDVRIVCATHRQLKGMVEAGEFREDLMFRINTFEVVLPPLRDRIEDIPELASHLLQRFVQCGGRQQLFTDDALEGLLAYHWPGNIRELANVIEHATILCDELPIRAEHLPRIVNSPRPTDMISGPMTLREIELYAIHRAIDRHNGNKAAAAEELDVSVKTLYNRLNQAESLEKAG